MSSMLRTIDRSITRAENLPPWRLRNQPSHEMRTQAHQTRGPVEKRGNAARRARRADPKAGPAEQPRRLRRARYYRFASRLAEVRS